MITTFCWVRHDLLCERIICAAIKHKDHGIFAVIVMGNCINQAGKYYHNTDNDKTWKQGFIIQTTEDSLTEKKLGHVVLLVK